MIFSPSVPRWGANALAVVLLNVVLAGAMNIGAPRPPRHSDRQAYEYVGQHAFEPNCGWSIYCYRVLVPMLLERIPVDAERRWRWYQALATSVAGSISTLAILHVVGSPLAAIVGAVLVQTSYGFTFTAYDPYTADPMVFVFAAAIAWCWFADRWVLALLFGLVGIFAKETVALVSASCLLAALAGRRRTWRAWVVSSAAVGATLLAFRWVMDQYFGWGVSDNPAAQFSRGSWIVVWWENNPFLIRKLYLLFAPFGFAWLFAMLGFRVASAPLRHLALGAIVPFLALCYVQTPERALSNAFFIVVPLAALFLSRIPSALAVLTVLVNGAATAKIGSSTAWLPPSSVLMVPALALTILMIGIWLRKSHPRGAGLPL